MVVLAVAAIEKGKNGKPLFLRSTVPVSRSRLDSLLNAFPKLVDPTSPCTYIETDSIRYVYHSTPELYILLITNKLSNLNYDHDGLRFIIKLLSSICDGQITSTMLSDSDLIFRIFMTLDEVIECGYIQPVTQDVIQSNLLMDSHEEYIFNLEKQRKMHDAKEQAKNKAHDLDRQKRLAQMDPAYAERMVGYGSSAGSNSPSGGANDYSSYGSGSKNSGGSSSHHQQSSSALSSYDQVDYASTTQGGITGTQHNKSSTTYTTAATSPLPGGIKQAKPKITFGSRTALGPSGSTTTTVSSQQPQGIRLGGTALSSNNPSSRGTALGGGLSLKKNVPSQQRQQQQQQQEQDKVQPHSATVPESKQHQPVPEQQPQQPSSTSSADDTPLTRPQIISKENITIVYSLSTNDVVLTLKGSLSLMLPTIYNDTTSSLSLHNKTIAIPTNNMLNHAVTNPSSASPWANFGQLRVQSRPQLDRTQWSTNGLLVQLPPPNPSQPPPPSIYTYGPDTPTTLLQWAITGNNAQDKIPFTFSLWVDNSNNNSNIMLDCTNILTNDDILPLSLTRTILTIPLPQSTKDIHINNDNITLCTGKWKYISSSHTIMWLIGDVTPVTAGQVYSLHFTIPSNITQDDIMPLSISARPYNTYDSTLTGLQCGSIYDINTNESIECDIYNQINIDSFNIQ